MKLHDAGITIIIALALLAALGYFSAKIIGKDDQPIEEVSEAYIERKLEEIMNKEQGEYEGLIDLTPSSKEA